MSRSGRPAHTGWHPVEKLGHLGERLDRLRSRSRRRATLWAAAVAGIVGLNAAIGIAVMAPRLDALREEAERARAAERDALGQMALSTLEADQLRQVLEYSARYRIPADLARSIHTIALSEDLDPGLAFRLVETESSFRRLAISEAGAIGYTQLLPSTARWLDPRVSDADLFDPRTNLRLGFRYLRLLLEDSDGDVRLALLAYNRGPGRVRSIVARGEDPGNGYATRIIGSE